MTREQELRMLKDQAEMLENQLKQIKKRLEELGE
jgi:prefoldin subunit 5